MLIVCPNCKKQFDVDPAIARDSGKMRCSSCRAVFRLVRKTEAESAPAAQLKVVIANESVAFCEAVRKVLSAEPFELFVCNDGKEALETVQRVRPDLLLLDVALPTMFGFEVCERVRQDPALSGVKIVLIASIYDKTRYKRSPNSLYGADDYIEKHHIPDALVPMIYRLASRSVPVQKKPTLSEQAAQEETRTEIRQMEVEETSSAAPAAATPAAAAPAPATPAAATAAPATAAPAAAAPAALVPEASEPAAPAPATPVPAAASAAEAGTAGGRAGSAVPAGLSEAETKARRLARIIVSDIVLYNQGKVEQGIREGTFYNLLADDIREGELLYRQRVSQEVRDTTSFMTDAFDELIAKKRAELRI